MDQQTLEMIEVARKSDPHLEKLVQSHQELNQQVDTLNSQSYQSEEDTRKLHVLKKEKLRVRDMIELAVHGARSA